MGELPVMTRKVLMKLSKERLVDIILIQAETIVRLEATIVRLEKRIEELEARLNANSSKSNQPPSSDSPFKKPVREPGNHGKPGGKKGHKGHRQQMLSPSDTKQVQPAPCSCSCGAYGELEPFYTHQHIELPEIELEVTHFVLLKGQCAGCGRINKARVPSEYRSGYGPRMSALIAELAGSHGDSRSIIQNFCASVLGLPISLGTIQKVLDRASEAIRPHYEAKGEEARRQAGG